MRSSAPPYFPPPRIQKQYALKLAHQKQQRNYTAFNTEIPGPLAPVPIMMPMMINNKRRQSYSDNESSDGDESSSVPSLRENSESTASSANIYVHSNNRKHTFYYQQKVPSRSPAQTPSADPNKLSLDAVDSCQFELDMRKTNGAISPYSTVSPSESPGLFPTYSHNMNMVNNQMGMLSQPMMMNHHSHSSHYSMTSIPSSLSPSNVQAAAFTFPPPQQHAMYNVTPPMFNCNMTPPPPMYHLQPMRREGECFVCIDVECAATGYGHFDSAPCRIAMVDFFGEVLFDRIAQVPNLVDPLSEFTGLTKWEIQNKGDSLQKVLSEFHSLLGSLNKQYEHGVTIIGQSVIMDIVWAALVPNIHYTRVIDIAHLFKTKNAKWDSFMFYSLRQVAWALLNCEMNTEFHDPTEDAAVTIKLWRDFCLDPQQLENAKGCLRSFKSCNHDRFPDFKVYCKFNQCSGMYNPSRCRCGQKTAIHIDGMNDMEKLRDLYLEHRSKPVLYDADEEFDYK